MTRDEPASILPVPGGVARPRWSVMIPTYRCSGYLPATLSGVLEQDPGPDFMQIEVVDDDSDDHPDEVVERVAGGRVSFWRQPRNVGISANLTGCITRSTGEYVHILHGDDLAYPGLYEKAGAVLDADPSLDAVFVGAEDVDSDGRVCEAHRPLRPGAQLLDDFEPEMFAWNPVRAPAVLARRSFYERHGGFHPDLRYCADWDMWKRMVTCGRVAYLPEVLAGYRVHSGSDTARLGRSPAQLREMMRSVRISHRYPSRTQTRRWTPNVYWTVGRWAAAAMREPGRSRPQRLLGYLPVVVEAGVRRRADRLIGALSRP